LVVHNKGCFLADSPILKGNGEETPIREVRKGDELLAFTPEGRLVRTRVRDVIRIEADRYVVLRTERTELRVTEEHPFYVGGGTYKTPESLRPGDTLFAWDGQSFSEQRILSMQRVNERIPVYNLQTDRPNTFFAGRIAVHNKGGGCFPMGTRIAAPGGSVPIDGLAPGDEVTGVDPSGNAVRATVGSLILARSPGFRVETEEGSLTTTPEHPVGLWGGGFLSASRLRPGDRIRQWSDRGLRMATVLGTSSDPEERLVFNLRVSGPHTFLAEGVVVHNKGGSSSRSSSSRSSSSRSRSGGSSEDDWIGLIFFGVFFLLVVIFITLAVRSAKRAKSQNLDFRYSPGQVAKKAGKTGKLLTFLSQQDPELAPDRLRTVAEATFRKLQECWQGREYGPMKPLLMQPLYVQHVTQLQGMVRNHEINRLENLRVERIDLVNVRYTEKPDQREFTALISASVRDYYVDDRTNKFIRGDTAAARFQEFWTFQRAGQDWLLREIEQAGESDLLKEENFVELLTEETVQRIYGEEAREGVAGPWLEKGEETKASRTERLLNFLVQTDKIWNRQQMLEGARRVFMAVYLARESGDSKNLPSEDLFPEVAESLREQMGQWDKDGLRVEYRNLCVRKAELLLVRNFADNTRDEFTVRIDAHAQKVVRKGERKMSEQQYVTPFEEFWTFGRLDGRWRLKEVLPPGPAKRLASQENVDEDSSAGQLEWYYRQKRAN
jgi:predicted lipid-binding transport protein (Tim44 family)